MDTIVKIDSYSGRSIPVVGNEIDTDRIIPARFMKCVTFSGLGKYAFYDERFDDDGTSKNHIFDDPDFSKHPVLIVNKNFGCGSSREHAPQALRDYGIRAIIGESFAEIFAGNCTALGIPAVQLSEEDIADIQNAVSKHPETEVSIDLIEKRVTAGDRLYSLDMPEAYRKALLDGTWDSTSLLLSGMREITEVRRNLPYLNF